MFIQFSHWIHLSLNVLILWYPSIFYSFRKSLQREICCLSVLKWGQVSSYPSQKLALPLPSLFKIFPTCCSTGTHPFLQATKLILQLGTACRYADARALSASIPLWGLRSLLLVLLQPNGSPHLVHIVLAKLLGCKQLFWQISLLSTGLPLSTRYLRGWLQLPHTSLSASFTSWQKVQLIWSLQFIYHTRGKV